MAASSAALPGPDPAPPSAARVLAHMKAVAELRRRTAADPRWAARVHEVKAYQAQRFGHTYADMLNAAQGGERRTARFFLAELYGPHDFTERDAQFSRVLPTMARVFPQELLRTLEQLGALHELTERLDAALAAALPTDGRPLTAAAYAQAWQAASTLPDRQAQIDGTLAVGHALDGFTRHRSLRMTLKLMRGPARAAGLGALQHFLETGFDAFAALGGADAFLSEIERREGRLVEALFAADAVARCRQPRPQRPVALAELP